MNILPLLFVGLLSAFALWRIWQSVTRLEEEENACREAFDEAYRKSLLSAPEPLNRDGKPHCLTSSQAWYHTPEAIEARRKRMLRCEADALLDHWWSLRPDTDEMNGGQ